MSKKNFKRIAALTMAATMTIGSAMTVFAADGAGVATGTGSYEGGEMKYPTLSVQLPTILAGTYDYIADPNGLIAATSNEKYANAVFSGNTGVFFKTGKDSSDTAKDSYTEKSAAQTVTNENAQDIDVTVKLEQKTAGDAVIKYAESSTFEAADKENKLYLAVTDDAQSSPKVAALSSNGAATVTTTVAGVPGNYEPGYAQATGYAYTKKDDANLTDWNKCSFILTGAVNKNATWGDNVTFPEIQVTWSVKEHKDSVLSGTTVSAANNTLTVNEGATVTKVTLVQTSGSRIAAKSGTHYTFANGTLSLQGTMLSGNVGGSLEIELKVGEDTHTETVTIQ